jgi:hypothetical protein
MREYHVKKMKKLASINIVTLCHKGQDYKIIIPNFIKVSKSLLMIISSFFERDQCYL